MTNAISVENLSFSYGKKQVINNISFQVEEDSVFFLVGNNGSGKTTLMNCILRILTQKEGTICVLGKDTKVLSLNEISQMMSYVPQNTAINCGFNVIDYLVLGRNPYITLGNPKNEDFDKVEFYAKKTGITDLFDKKFNELSGGQKQWCSITRALVQETPIIVLDEPMSALDMGRQAEFLVLLRELKEEGKTIFLTTHNPNHCTKLDCTVCWLNNMEIYAIGTPEDVFTNESVKSIYGDYVKVTTDLYVDFNMK